jgi:hypothetical protein
MSPTAPTSSPPWWKFGHVWLVIAGPAVVVVASFITVYLAVFGKDPVVDEDYYRKGIEINKTLQADPASWHPPCRRSHAATVSGIR